MFNKLTSNLLNYNKVRNLINIGNIAFFINNLLVVTKIKYDKLVEEILDKIKKTIYI